MSWHVIGQFGQFSSVISDKGLVSECAVLHVLMAILIFEDFVDLY